MRIAIMVAMPDEVYTIHNDIKFHQEEIHGERTYYFSRHRTIEMVLVNSKCGKVSAASTATSLIEKYNVDHILFTGVAGAVDTNLNVGDIVLAQKSYQHDMDARPIFPRFEIPLTGRALLSSAENDLITAKNAIENFLGRLTNYVPANVLKEFNISKPKLMIGTIATGDQFIKDPIFHDGLKYENEAVLAVEMEGAAAAQVCQEHKVPFTLIRTISDKADNSAHVDFQKFIIEIASHYSSGIVQEYLKTL